MSDKQHSPAPPGDATQSGTTHFGFQQVA